MQRNVEVELFTKPSRLFMQVLGCIDMANIIVILNSIGKFLTGQDTYTEFR